MRRNEYRRGLTGKDKFLIFLTFFFMVAGTAIFGAVVYHKTLLAAALTPAPVKKKDGIPFEIGKKEGEYLSKDGAVMVEVKAGKFIMGSPETGGLAEKNLGLFLIDKTEVTCKQYQKFLQENPDWKKGGREALNKADANYLKDWTGDQFPQGKGDHPVVWVSLYAAQAYAKWVGKRLPSEMEWEKAARGTDGRPYPWGKEEPTHNQCNFGLKEKGTLPANSMEEGASPSGCLHMAGNVWEWCSDDYKEEGMEGLKVLKGGSFKNLPLNLKTYYRLGESPEVCDDHIGFRCCWSK